MAITIHIYYTSEGDNARRFAQEMCESGLVDEIRAEEGNLKYEYFFPLEDAHTVLLIDAWKDQQALDVHHHSPMMQKITALREKYNLHMKVERFVSDETGVPAQDRAFIKE
ncbi:MAG: antibiotic biosynthesis monooxygenase [Ruminococcaceae bacterium]|nr:antibiotic biosynthesis monooxygenase [Oscillospiraceae bacterium]